MDKAVLKKKAESYLEQEGYIWPEEKSGFDICRKKMPQFRNEYLAVGCNVNDEVTIRYFNLFNKNLAKFQQEVKQATGSFSSVKGLIAYSGNCTKDIKIKARAARIKHKKFQ